MFLVKKLSDFKKRNIVKDIIREVPAEIIPESKLIEFVVKHNRRYSDDNVYEDNPDLHKYFPRGLTALSINNSFEFIIHGNYKFADKPLVKNLCGFIERHNAADHPFKVIATSKINGEAAHFSGRYINDKFYFIAGSKHVHLIFSHINQLSLYVGAHYNIAKDVSQSLWSIYEKLSLSERTQFRNYLDSTKHTVICEITNRARQHIIPILDDGGLYILMENRAMDDDEIVTSLTATSIISTFDRFSDWGFRTPTYDATYNESNLYHHKCKVRNMKDSEGVVYYFVSNIGETVCILKYKSIEYIHLRAIRELTKHKNARADRIVHKMHDLQKWLNITTQETENWIFLAQQFIRYGPFNMHSFVPLWADFMRKSVSSIAITE